MPEIGQDEFGYSLPYHIRAHQIEVMSDESYITLKHEQTLHETDRARRLAPEDSDWRFAIARYLDGLGHREQRDKVATCMQIWKNGRPFRCRYHQFCLPCLKWRTRAIWYHDETLLRAYGVRDLLTCISERSSITITERRHLLGHRHLYLPETARHRWFLIPKSGDDRATPTLERALDAALQHVSEIDAAALYAAPIHELEHMGPVKSIETALSLDKRVVTTRSGGLLAEKLKRKGAPIYFDVRGRRRR